MGRSYGDAAQLDGRPGARRHARSSALTLDPAAGTVTAEAGRHDRRAARRAVPAGWMLPVVPGTQHVTVGGAIAADIHGKNHGSAGTFGSPRRALGAADRRRRCARARAGTATGICLRATVGGMGLTGVILWARIRLVPVSSALLSVDTDRVADLDAALSALAAPGGEYRVAWLDLLGSRPGRGIVTRARHVDLPAGARHCSGAAPPCAPARRCRRVGRGACCVQPPCARSTSCASAAPLRVASGDGSRASARTCSRSTRSTPGRGCTGGGAWCSTSSWCRPGRSTCSRRLVDRLRRGGVPCYLAVLKDFGAAKRRAALISAARLDACARHATRRTAAWPRCSTASTSWSPASVVACIWQRTLACDRETLAAMYPELASSGVTFATSSIPTAFGGRTWASGRAWWHRAINERRPQTRVLLVGGTSEIGLAIVRRLGLRRSGAGRAAGPRSGAAGVRGSRCSSAMGVARTGLHADLGGRRASRPRAGGGRGVRALRWV